MLDPTSSVGISTVYVEDAASPTVPGVSAGPGRASRSTVQVEVAAGLTVFHNRLSGGRRGSDCLSQPSKWRSPRGRLSLTTVQVEVAAGPAGPGRASRRRAEPKARGADGERAGRPRGDRNSHSWLDPKVPQARMSSTHSLVTRNKMRKRASERESEFLEACLRTGNRVP